MHTHTHTHAHMDTHTPTIRGLEVRSFEQKIQVQAIRPESSIKFVASSKNTLIASTSNVYKLEPCPYDRQVQSCIQNKQFELALSIAVSSLCRGHSPTQLSLYGVARSV